MDRCGRRQVILSPFGCWGIAGLGVVTDAGERLIELVEDRLIEAERLNLSVAGLVARVYTLVEAGDLEAACQILETLDQLINQAEERS